MSFPIQQEQPFLATVESGVSNTVDRLRFRVIVRSVRRCPHRDNGPSDSPSSVQRREGYAKFLRASSSTVLLFPKPLHPDPV